MNKLLSTVSLTITLVFSSCVTISEKETISVFGCTDSKASNYIEQASNDDGSCEYILGCTDALANNYDPRAGVDDNSCEYYTKVIFYSDGSWLNADEWVVNIKVTGPDNGVLGNIGTFPNFNQYNFSCETVGSNNSLIVRNFLVARTFDISVNFAYEFYDNGLGYTVFRNEIRTYTITAPSSTVECKYVNLTF